MAVRAALAAVLAALVVSPTGRAQPLRTALMDPDAFSGPEAGLAFSRAASAGATSVRLVLRWSLVARNRPTGNPTDPSNPGYDWSSFDFQVERARAAGLDPIVCIATAPQWATDVAAAGRRTTWPRPDALGRFAAAAVRRYAPAGVHVWQVWNEPNARSHLNPQYAGSRPVAARHYRRMVAAFSDAVHVVDARFTVVAGALAPFGHHSRDIQVVAPLRFMRELLCVSRSGMRTCRTRVPFDVWAHNPYTNGGPTHHAAADDDVSIGDLPEMRRLLVRGERSGNVVSRTAIEFWVSEFAWDTKPSDPLAVPLSLHSRWVAEALYRMWSAGVSLVTWWRLRDDPLSRTPYQSGLWFRGGDALASDRPKRSLTAFRFPFVALRSKHGVSVWGRTPGSPATRVVIERRTTSRWHAVATLAADGDRIFRAQLPIARTGALRARVEGAADASLPFSLVPPPGLKVFPFGCGGSIRCSPRG
jgi:hypothetical protein